jgi:Transposase, Mutator family
MSLNTNLQGGNYTCSQQKEYPTDDKGATPTVVSSDHLKPEDFHQYLRAEIRDATRMVMEEIMREELSQFLGAAWGESTAQRKGHRNGFYTREPLDECWTDRRSHSAARSRWRISHASL